MLNLHTFANHQNILGVLIQWTSIKARIFLRNLRQYRSRAMS